MMQAYTKLDCEETGSSMRLTGKVVVLDDVCSKANGVCQVAFCLGGPGADASAKGGYVRLVDLMSSQRFHVKREGVLGVLRPGLLPEEARLQLSQIRPVSKGEADPDAELFSGYCFLEDGRYAAGVWLNGAKEAVDYAFMQKPYQYRVMICDGDDFCVLEIVKDEVLFPKEDRTRTHALKEMLGEMSMT